ncbi:hypothetical protein EU546_05980 [Candidatus Thorarchaeota archaeon]|nr:MAG: hypothetical protein EU546_05980 [Candidatus Thorarchaeota archaeon]
MPERIECPYCGRQNEPTVAECQFCGAALSDADREAYCDWCGIPLGRGREPAGKCVVCGAEVFLCEKHKRKAVKDEIYCKEHQSECFIATAVIGTPLDPRIDLLRRFRDERMLTSRLGSVMTHLYYELSPPIARQARWSPLLKKILRLFVVDPWLAVAGAVLDPSDY